MKRKLLSVMHPQTNYVSFYEVTYAHSFEQAKEMIIAAENSFQRYDDLDLPVSDEKSFWEFIDWMESTGRKYPFSIFGCKSDKKFWEIAEIARARGFHFNS